jgi:acyl-CoA reductase-like NAD-dependent aldehyde dehydrogenase
VLAVLKFSSDEEAVRIANATNYGLVAGVWSKDVTRAHSVAKELRAGTVWINTYRTLAAQAPFGGIKASGYGRERGFEGILEFLATKATIIALSSDVRDPSALGT